MRLNENGKSNSDNIRCINCINNSSGTTGNNGVSSNKIITTSITVPITNSNITITKTGVFNLTN